MQTLEDDFTLPTEQEYRLYELAQRDSELASSHFTETATSTPAIGTYTTALDLAPMPEDVQITTPNLLPESFVHSSQTSSLGQNSEDSFWHAVVMRDPATVGTFWYGVTSTKICA